MFDCCRWGCSASTTCWRRRTTTKKPTSLTPKCSSWVEFWPTLMRPWLPAYTQGNARYPNHHSLVTKLQFHFQYIFEGLGHLIAKILISSVQYMQHINEGGIQRMIRNIFALQQTLTNITMTREVALDHARHYFELFCLTPEVKYVFNSLQVYFIVIFRRFWTE